MYYRAYNEVLCGHCAIAVPKNNIQEHGKNNHPNCVVQAEYKWIL